MTSQSSEEPLTWVRKLRVLPSKEVMTEFYRTTQNFIETDRQLQSAMTGLGTKYPRNMENRAIIEEMKGKLDECLDEMDWIK